MPRPMWHSVRSGISETRRSAVVGNTTIRERLADTTADASVGFTGSVRPGFALHLDVRYQQSTEAEERDGVRANFGFRMAF